MAKNPQELADLLGAKVVGELPDVGGGPFGMARLAYLMHQRLKPSQGERPGRPTDSEWVSRPKVPMSGATQRRLAEIAETLSTPGIRVSPMQVAAQLLEEALRQVAVPSRKPIQNPWERLPQLAPFILPEDAARVASFNESAPEDLRLHLDVLPEPFVGRREAPVVLLNLNPGYSPEGPRFHGDPSFAARLRRNLLHLPAEYPLYLLDPEVTGPGHDWWKSKLRHLIKQVGYRGVANGVLCVEYFPYHSRRFKHGRLSLPSQQYSFSLVREVLERQAVVILLRGRRLWFRAVPELQSYPLYRVKNWRKPTISPRNCPEGFERAVEVLKAGERRPAEETMNPVDMLAEVQNLLQQIAGTFGGRRHYRTIRLRGNRALGVGVFGHGNSRGHIRVHVRNVAQDEAGRIPRVGAPSVPGLLPSVCPRCRNNLPAAFPEWYHGPREDGNRAYFGFQWHSPDGLSRADVPLIEDCARWLLQHFPLR
jgi:hypothetical protein